MMRARPRPTRCICARALNLACTGTAWACKLQAGAAKGIRECIWFLPCLALCFLPPGAGVGAGRAAGRDALPGAPPPCRGAGGRHRPGRHPAARHRAGAPAPCPPAGCVGGTSLIGELGMSHVEPGAQAPRRAAQRSLSAAHLHAGTCEPPCCACLAADALSA